MTLSLDRTYVSEPSQEWLIGNARLVSFSGLLLGAHLAHAALIMLWAGSFTLYEAARIQPNLPLGEQGFTLLPHLAVLGFGIGDGGFVVDSYPYLVVGVLHLAASAVLAAGGLFHVVRGPAKLEEAEGQAGRFGYRWDDGGQLTIILGHHLIFLGLGALGLYFKATRWGGIYDSTIQSVRLVETPTFDPVQVFGYLAGQTPDGYNNLGMAAVSNLEDIIGGHLWVAILLLGGGVWHVLTPLLPWAKRILRIEGEALLSYSLGGVAYMAFISYFYVLFNPVAFPTELFGSDRLTPAGSQLLVGLVALLGHLWHAYRVLKGDGLKADPNAKPPSFQLEAVESVTAQNESSSDESLSEAEPQAAF